MSTAAQPRQPVTAQETPGGDRVREHTDPDRLRQIDEQTRQHVARYLDADEATITRRIEQVENETDMERLLQINASTLALTGTLLGLLHSRRWFAVPVVVLSFLLQHGLQGWCPPVVVFRRLGVRSRQEIDGEKQALKALRGDFDALRAARTA